MSGIMQNVCCAHTRVVLGRTVHSGGRCSDFWECSDCGTRFWPESFTARTGDEVANLQTAVNVYKHTVEVLRAQLAAVKLEMARLKAPTPPNAPTEIMSTTYWREETWRLTKRVEQVEAELDTLRNYSRAARELADLRARYKDATKVLQDYHAACGAITYEDHTAFLAQAEIAFAKLKLE